MLSTPNELSHRSSPVSSGERIPVLDVLRGFALLGIAIINMSGFKTPDHAVAVEQLFPGFLNHAASWLIDVFGDGKFNSIFSFLFGVGLTIQLERAEARHAPFVELYLRRLAVLMALGLVHCFLIWNGDVLHIYAILGLALLLLRRIPDRFVLALIMVLLLTPMAWSGYRYFNQTPPDLTRTQREEKARQELKIYGHGTYAEMTRNRAEGFREAYTQGWGYLFMAQMGVTLLIGFSAGRHRIFRDLPAHLPLIRRVFFWGLASGLGCALFFATARALRDPNQERTTLLALSGTIAYQLNRPLLSLVYIAGIVLLSQRVGWQSRFEPLAAVGRMPLTNYLMQSVIATTIFYSYGLGYFGQVGPAIGLLISLAIYAVQVIYSGWWMARFQFGPLEWLWRAVTYGYFPPLVLRREPIGTA